jgi:hypothetical protein
MAIDLPTAAAPSPSVVSATEPQAASFDERWAAWQAKGDAHERAVRRKVAIAAPILIVAAGVVIYVLLGR